MAKHKKITKITKVTRIRLDDAEEDSDYETPEEIRKLLADRDADEVADGVQGAGIQGGVLHHESKISYEFNGTKYNSLDEMPPKVRAYFENMGMTAGAFEGASNARGGGQWAHEETRDMPPLSDISSEPTVEIHYAGGYDKLKYVVAVVVAVLVGLALYFLLRS